MIKIGEVIYFDSLEHLLKGVLTYNMMMFLRYTILENVESAADINFIEVRRINRASWHVEYINTDYGDIDITDKKLILSANCYDTKPLLNAKLYSFENVLGSVIERYKPNF
jgi:hypothetical protein